MEFGNRMGETSSMKKIIVFNLQIERKRYLLYDFSMISQISKTMQSFVMEFPIPIHSFVSRLTNGELVLLFLSVNLANH